MGLINLRGKGFFITFNSKGRRVNAGKRYETAILVAYFSENPFGGCYILRHFQFWHFEPKQINYEKARGDTHEEETNKLCEMRTNHWLPGPAGRFVAFTGVMLAQSAESQVLKSAPTYGNSKGWMCMVEDFIMVLPSGKRLHNYGTSPFSSWENPLFQWQFSIAM